MKMGFESMNSASILLMLGFAAIMVMFLFVMRSLDSLVKSLREERRVLISNLDTLSQDIRSIKMNLSQGTSGNQSAAKHVSTTFQTPHTMTGAAPQQPASTSAPSMPGPSANPASASLSKASGNNTASPAPTSTIASAKGSKDDFFLDLSLKDASTPKANNSPRIEQPAKRSSLELKL